MSNCEKIHYYTKSATEPMHRISKEEADEIERFNRSLPFGQWDKIQFVFCVKADD